MNKNNLAFTRKNFILLAVGVAIVILGFILMSGAGSTEEAFNPDIFSTRRIKIAPATCMIGFIITIVAILYPANKKESNPGNQENPIANSKQA